MAPPAEIPPEDREKLQHLLQMIMAETLLVDGNRDREWALKAIKVVYKMARKNKCWDSLYEAVICRELGSRCCPGSNEKLPGGYGRVNMFFLKLFRYPCLRYEVQVKSTRNCRYQYHPEHINGKTCFNPWHYHQVNIPHVPISPIVVNKEGDYGIPPVRIGDWLEDQEADEQQRTLLEQERAQMGVPNVTVFGDEIKMLYDRWREGMPLHDEGDGNPNRMSLADPSMPGPAPPPQQFIQNGTNGHPLPPVPPYPAYPAPPEAFNPDPLNIQPFLTMQNPMNELTNFPQLYPTMGQLGQIPGPPLNFNQNFFPMQNQFLPQNQLQSVQNHNQYPPLMNPMNPINFNQNYAPQTVWDMFMTPQILPNTSNPPIPPQPVAPETKPEVEDVIYHPQGSDTNGVSEEEEVIPMDQEQKPEQLENESEPEQEPAQLTPPEELEPEPEQKTEDVKMDEPLQETSDVHMEDVGTSEEVASPVVVPDTPQFFPPAPPTGENYYASGLSSPASDVGSPLQFVPDPSGCLPALRIKKALESGLDDAEIDRIIAEAEGRPVVKPKRCTKGKPGFYPDGRPITPIEPRPLFRSSPGELAELVSNHGTFECVEYVERGKWLALQYFEEGNALGEVREYESSHCLIDGFSSSEGKSNTRFSIGYVNNPTRSALTSEVRALIGKGIRLYLLAGEVYIENLSTIPVFVQSISANMKNGFELNTVSKLPPATTMKVFDMRQFSKQLAQAATKTYNDVYSLNRMCTLRFAFVKGWGDKYRRNSVTRAPVWFHAHLFNPVAWIDSVLNCMGAPPRQMSSRT